MNPTTRRLFAASACVFTLSAMPALAQEAPRALPTAAETAAAAGDPAATDDVVILSPFEVVDDTRGYYAANTMSGTRMNSKIEDLGQSITVMTKEQMADFAMIDINDVFDYMASTEGTGSYSAFVVDRTGAVTDNVSGDPNNANRVRGIGAANIAFNNIATTGRVPVDPLWMDSIELSRGPNANLFGLGNTSGTVNQVSATANPSRDFTRVQLRGDSYGGWRTSLDVNRMVIKDKLAIRASFAKQHTAFIRKPSGEDARRTSVQVKAKPFKNTTISLNWYGYKNTARRPNFTTPRDYITGWYAAGSPAWNPVTGQVFLNGVSYGATSSAGRGLLAGSNFRITTYPSYFSAADNRSRFIVGGEGETPYWEVPVATEAFDPMTATAAATSPRYVNTAASNSVFGAVQPLFATTAPLSDKSVYDWEEINLMANGQQVDRVDTYLAQLDQLFINTAQQTLAFQATFMREDANQLQDLPFGPASVNSTVGEIRVDPNFYRLDGSLNPYFGRPYAKTTEPFLRDKPMLWDTYRAQAVYRFDFSQNKGWSKWLGSQQILAYTEYKDQQNRQYAYRHTATSLDQPWLQRAADAGIPLANRTTTNTKYPILTTWNNTTQAFTTTGANYNRLYEQYYLGDTPGGGIEYAPRYFPNDTTLPFVWGNPTTGFNYNPTTVGWTPSPDGGGSQASAQRVVKTVGGVMQSTFLDGRLVATFGLRKDKVFERNAVLATLTPDLRAYDFKQSNQWLPDWRLAQGQTKSMSLVARPFRDLGFLKSRANGGSGIGRFFAEALSSFSLTYNKSDNFIPQGPAIDLMLNDLPNQTGKSTDYGFWMTMLDGKLSIRYNHFETVQLNARDGDINTIATRVIRADGFNANDAWNLLDRATEWVTQLNPTWSTEQINAEVAEQMGVSLEVQKKLTDAMAAGVLAATQDIVSKGHELEINYNPSRNWTISGSVTKTESINQNAGSSIEDYINMRMPYWTTIEDPRFIAGTLPAGLGGGPIPTGATGHLLWREIAGRSATLNDGTVVDPSTAAPTYGYNRDNSAASNYVTFVEGPLAVFRQTEGKPRPQMAKYSAKLNAKYTLAGITENRILRNVSIGGSVRWQSKKSIGYYGVGYVPGMDLTLVANRITALDVNRPIYSPSETYVDLFISYRTKMFRDKIQANFQINVRNVGEDGGGLKMTQAFPDGTALAYRIIDPRQFIFTASFDL